MKPHVCTAICAGRSAQKVGEHAFDIAKLDLQRESSYESSMIFSIPLTITVDVASPQIAQQLGAKANQLLNDPMTKLLLKGQGLPIVTAKVGTPTQGG